MNQSHTLTKALDILNLLAQYSDGLTVEKISSLLSIPASTTYRLIQTLDSYEFTTHISRGTITLGSGLLALCRKVNMDYENQLCEIALPIMNNLTELTNETSILHIRSGIYTTCLTTVPSKSMIRFVAESRRFLPISLGCSGIAILAFESQSYISSILEKLEPSTHNELLAKISFTQQNGYYLSHHEYDQDTLGIGVPIFNKDKKIYASLSIVGPEFRMNTLDMSTTISTLKSCSKLITSSLS